LYYGACIELWTVIAGVNPKTISERL